jgi:hypothetical protein
MIGIGLRHLRNERGKKSIRGGVVRVLHHHCRIEIGDIRRRRGGRLRINGRGGRMVGLMLGEEVLEVDLEVVIEGEWVRVLCHLENFTSYLVIEGV